MRRTFFMAAAGLALTFAATASVADTEVAALSWLAGCWAAERGEAGSGEHWMPPAGGTMLGVARTVRNGATVGHEFLQIREEADGNVVYVALPSGQAETTFVMTASAPDSVTFENPRHDFPQRITYRLLSADRLAVRIEGVRDATPRQV